MKEVEASHEKVSISRDSIRRDQLRAKEFCYECDARPAAGCTGITDALCGSTAGFDVSCGAALSRPVLGRPRPVRARVRRTGCPPACLWRQRSSPLRSGRSIWRMLRSGAWSWRCLRLDCLACSASANVARQWPSRSLAHATRAFVIPMSFAVDCIDCLLLWQPVRAAHIPAQSGHL